MACGSRDAQTLALTEEGCVYSWGDGDFGKLGMTSHPQISPVCRSHSSKFVYVIFRDAPLHLSAIKMNFPVLPIKLQRSVVMKIMNQQWRRKDAVISEQISMSNVTQREED